MLFFLQANDLCFAFIEAVSTHIRLALCTRNCRNGSELMVLICLTVGINLSNPLQTLSFMRFSEVPFDQTRFHLSTIV